MLTMVSTAHTSFFLVFLKHIMSQTVKGTVCTFIRHPHYELLDKSKQLCWLNIKTHIVDDVEVVVGKHVTIYKDTCNVNNKYIYKVVW